MKTLYIECKMGVAGDMLTASLLEHVNKEEFVKKINSLNVPGVSFEVERIKKNSIEGNKVHVVINGTEEGLESKEHNHHSHHTHTSLEDVSVLINAMDLSDKVKHDAINVYNLIANAESRVHGTSVKDIHFHEVGTIDAVIDVVSVCLLMEMISPAKVISSPINVGSGMVRCAHGILPVPAPATAVLLEEVPMYNDDDINTELCTPTGAALVKFFADEFGDIPVMKLQSTGYGFGTKEFDKPNCVRTFLGEENTSDCSDRVVELKCNIDDMSGEDMGFCIDKLLEEGAIDVFTTPIYMKKNRPGVLLTVICREDSKKKLVEQIFQYTTTIGIREAICDRYILDREEEIRKTEYGDVRIKKVKGYGVSREKIEYEDIKRLANDNSKSPKEIRDKLKN